MNNWDDIDRYFELTIGGMDPELAQALERCALAGLPAINVSPLQGRFL